MKGFKVLLLLTALTVIFVAIWQNVKPLLGLDVTFGLDLYWIKWETSPIPIIVLCPLAFFAGLALMYFVNMITILQLKKRVKSLENMPDGSSLSADQASSVASSRPENDAHKVAGPEEETPEESPQA